MFRIANPDFLWGLLIIPILVGGMIYSERKKQSGFLLLGDIALLKRMTDKISRRRILIKQVCRILAVSFLIVATAGIEVGTRYEPVTLQGVDVVIALDISVSMNAEDIQPNRLEKAKHAIGTLLRKLGGDRVALVVFAGQAFIQCPLTSDYSAVRLFVDAVDVQSTTAGGTNFAAMINVSRQAFVKKENTEKALVIFSDGEDQEGGVGDLAEILLKDRVHVYCFGVAAGDPVPIPIYKDHGQRDYKKHRGSVVTTKLEDKMLKDLAANTNGMYAPISSGESEIDVLAKRLGQLEKSESTEYQYTEYENRFQWFLGISVVCFLASIGVHERKSS